MRPIFGVLLLFASLVAGAQTSDVPSKNPASPTLDQSEALAKQYLDSFKKTGVPTAQTVTAAIEKARQQGTIEAWSEAAAVANAYANVVDVLTDHYSKLYYASRSGRGDGNFAYISKAADYEKLRNQYLKLRNDAYLEVAKLHSAKGEKAKALSFVITAVSLSGAEPNAEGEKLIRQLIELDAP